MKKTVSLVLAFVIVLSLAGCGKVTENLSPTRKPEPEQTQTVPAADPEPAVTEQPTEAPQEAPGEPLITALIDESGKYRDDCANEYDYLYRLPEIRTGTGEEIEEINVCIQTLRADIEEQLSGMEEGLSLSFHTVDYRIFREKEFTTLYIFVDYVWAWTDYFCFHFTNDGTILSTREICPYLGMTEEEFVSAAKNSIEQFWDERFADANEEIRDELNTYREKTLSAENCNIDLPAYRDENGSIRIIFKMYSLAGADYYYKDIELIS